MKLCIPHQTANHPPYCIPVKWDKFSGNYINKVMGIVARRQRYARALECFVHFAGHVSERAYIEKGR